ncbi:hypothetical protein HNR07_002285 [Nocardiopsis metallicus]|uniref:Uncharacterized protein n=1 Tax=Nocardiopsis metallicus TaxID=179819 RepID=A0A840WM13_9ACTN|nr:hypothetical protein [Nocardiopsis metallicus]
MHVQPVVPVPVGQRRQDRAGAPLLPAAGEGADDHVVGDVEGRKVCVELLLQLGRVVLAGQDVVDDHGGPLGAFGQLRRVVLGRGQGALVGLDSVGGGLAPGRWSCSEEGEQRRGAQREGSSGHGREQRWATASEGRGHVFEHIWSFWPGRNPGQGAGSCSTAGQAEGSRGAPRAAAGDHAQFPARRGTPGPGQPTAEGGHRGNGAGPGTERRTRGRAATVGWTVAALDAPRSRLLGAGGGLGNYCLAIS